MVAICCFHCDPRLAAYAISILSFLHFGVETILLISLDQEHRLVAEDEGIKFYIVLSTQIFLMVASILLFLGAFLLNKWLCIPWLLGCSFNLLLYLALLVLICGRLFTDFQVAELEKGTFIAFTAFVVAYCMWIIINFFWEVDKKDDDNLDEDYDKKGKSLFTLYDSDGGDEEDLFTPKKSRSRHASTKSFKSSKRSHHDDVVPLISNPILNK